MKPRLYSTLLIAALAALHPAARSGAAEDANTLRFSDPTRPGTMKIILARGDVRLQGADGPDVVVKSDAKAVSKTPRKDGLRVLSAAASYSLSEKDNVITLDAASDSLSHGGADFGITVPRGTAVVVQNSWGGNVTCAGVSGDIEINSLHGEIRLDDVAGGVVVSTMNGEIHAGIRELHDGKPLSFTSMNGEVTLRLPGEAKASVRLRTQNGAVLTDFDEAALVTKTENTAGVRRGSKAITIRNSKVIGPEVHDAIREAVHAGAVAVKEALAAVKEGVEAARQGAEEARRETDESKKATERAQLEVARERVRARAAEHRNTGANPATPPTPPVPPKPPTIPTISGGKLVTGALNGGGPEISVSTMNGDVILRKREAKP